MVRYYTVRPNAIRFQRHTPASFNGGRRVPLDVRVSDEDYVITASVPGLKAEDLQIELLDDVFTLRGKVEREDEGKARAVLCEIPTGEFERHLRLPDPVEPGKAEARLENGVLTVHLPKAEEAKPKTIPVKVR